MGFLLPTLLQGRPHLVPQQRHAGPCPPGLPPALRLGGRAGTGGPAAGSAGRIGPAAGLCGREGGGGGQPDGAGAGSAAAADAGGPRAAHASGTGRPLGAGACRSASFACLGSTPGCSAFRQKSAFLKFHIIIYQKEERIQDVTLPTIFLFCN